MKKEYVYFFVSSDHHEIGEQVVRQNQMGSAGTCDYIGHCCKSGHCKRFLAIAISYIVLCATVTYGAQLCEGVSWNQLAQYTD